MDLGEDVKRVVGLSDQKKNIGNSEFVEHCSKVTNNSGGVAVAKEVCRKKHRKKCLALAGTSNYNELHLVH